LQSTSEQFQATLTNWRSEIDLRLQNGMHHRRPELLYQPIAYVLEGAGKRIRPILLLLGCQAVGGDIKNCWQAACAIELLHNFTLVHDDIMDQDETRRGRPTLHEKYNASTALLAGDGMLAMAYQALLKSETPRLDDVVRTFTQGLVVVCEGQAQDMAFETRDDVQPEAYLDMIAQKTAKLLEVSARIGAMIGDGGEEEVMALGSFAHNLGVAFQIQDDALDITSNENTTGKTYGSDVKRKKQTFLLIHALSHANAATRKELQDILAGEVIEMAHIRRVKSIFEEVGSVSAARAATRDYLQNAESALHVLSPSSAKNHLLNFIDYIASRKS
jgi:geranylgeranyl diphosphate synthase type II